MPGMIIFLFIVAILALVYYCIVRSGDMEEPKPKKGKVDVPNN